MFLTIEPRALPWAGMLRPIGADRAVATVRGIGVGGSDSSGARVAGG